MLIQNPNYRIEKMESIRRDLINDQIAQQAEQDELFRDMLKADVSTWTDNTIEQGIEPTVAGFLTDYPHYDDERLMVLIECEMERVTELCRKKASA